MTNTEEVNPSFPNECPRGVVRDNDRTVSMVPGTSRGPSMIVRGGSTRDSTRGIDCPSLGNKEEHQCCLWFIKISTFVLENENSFR